METGGRDGGTVIRVAAGSKTDYTDREGNVWHADTAYTGGRVAVNSPPLPIAGTSDTLLYNSERFGGDATGNPTAFRYALAVDDGPYTVTLKFAETYAAINAAGKRRFNVSIDGQQVLTEFDIFASAGANTAIDKVFDVDVQGGTLTIAFSPGSVQSPKVDAVAVVPK
jgi:hypothetical protein